MGLGHYTNNYVMTEWKAYAVATHHVINGYYLN